MYLVNLEIWEVIYQESSITRVKFYTKTTPGFSDFSQNEKKIVKKRTFAKNSCTRFNLDVINELDSKN